VRSRCSRLLVVGAAAVVLDRELALAALSLGHHEPTVLVRSAVAAAATVLAAMLALLATRGRGRMLLVALRRRPTAVPAPQPRRSP
jgi:hypothetical protein